MVKVIFQGVVMGLAIGALALLVQRSLDYPDTEELKTQVAALQGENALLQLIIQVQGQQCGKKRQSKDQEFSARYGLPSEDPRGMQL